MAGVFGFRVVEFRVVGLRVLAPFLIIVKTQLKQLPEMLVETTTMSGIEFSPPPGAAVLGLVWITFQKAVGLPSII